MRMLKLFFLLACLITGVLVSHSQVPTYVPTDNLLAWYPFSGSAADATANGYNGSAIDVTAIADRSGNEGEAYFFNGSASEIVVPFDAVFNAFPFTVSLWCRLAEDDNGGVLIQRYTNASWNGWIMGVSETNGISQTVSPGYMLQAPPDCNGVVSNAQCGTGINYTGDIYDQMWHMLTFTVDGDSGRFYFDGVLQTTQLWSGTAAAPNGVSDLRIGGTDLGSSFFFHGGLDDVGIWNRALSNSEVITMFNGLPPVAGCTNSNACNYAPEATVNDGSCVLDCNGCIDPCACNYDENAAYDDGSCDYSCNVAMSFITVFHDENSNGVFDTGERPMHYWPVRITELDKIVYTNEDGMVLMPLPAGIIHYELMSANAEWLPTTAPTAEVTVPGSTQVFFGLQNATGIAAAETQELVGYLDYMHCEYGMESGLFVRNVGGQVLHGTLTLSCDLSFTPTMAMSISSPPNVAGPGFAQWDIENLQPWETRLLAFHIIGPGTASEGQAISYSLDIELRDQAEAVVYESSVVSSKDILCLEPSSQFVTNPEGYDDAFHYVPDGEELTFRIQFHNNSSDWIDDFMAIQNLNSQQFDLSTFELVYASESLVGCLHDDGTIDLQFSDLTSSPSPADPYMLGGYAVYRVDLTPGITPDSTFYHTMHIVLDMDSTIASDTIYHTIYDCNRLANVVGDEMYCEGDTVFLSSSDSWIDEYRWLLNDSLLSNESELRMLLEPGFYNVVSEFINPVCSVSSQKPITISEAPNASLVVAGDQLQSIGDYECQWYFNNELLQGETNAVLNIESEGIYQALWTSTIGCEAWSEEVLINHIPGNATDMELYPNPSNGMVRMDLPVGLYHVYVFDIGGRKVYDMESHSHASWLNLTSFKGGFYRVLAVSSNGSFSASLYLN